MVRFLKSNFIAIVYAFFLSGCADIAVKTYNSISTPSAEDITMKIYDSACDDLKWKIPANTIDTDEFFKLVRIQRNDTNNNKNCQITCTGGERLTGEERIVKCKQVANEEFSKQKYAADKQNEEIERQSAIAEEKTKKMYSDLAAKGYEKISIDDFHLDENTLPNGKKIYIDGYYEIYGDLQYIVKYPSVSYPQPQYQIPILTDDTERASKKFLIERQQNCVAGQGMCRFTVIGRVSRCEIKFLTISKVKTCISMDNFFYY